MKWEREHGLGEKSNLEKECGSVDERSKERKKKKSLNRAKSTGDFKMKQISWGGTTTEEAEKKVER